MDPCVPKGGSRIGEGGPAREREPRLAWPRGGAHGAGAAATSPSARRAHRARERWARMSGTELWESMPLSYRIGKPIAVAGAKSDQWSASCTSVWSSRPAKVPAPAKCFLVKLKQNESLRYRTCAKNFCLLKFG